MYSLCLCMRCVIVAWNPLKDVFLFCDRQWTVKASTASPTHCPETRPWWWSTAMTKTQTCFRYCFADTNPFLCCHFLLSTNSVFSCWQRAGNLSFWRAKYSKVWSPPQLIKICDWIPYICPTRSHCYRHMLWYGAAVFFSAHKGKAPPRLQQTGRKAKTGTSSNPQGQKRNSLYIKEIKWSWLCLYFSVCIYIPDFVKWAPFYSWEFPSQFIN